MNTVTFETAKRLKEAGFPQPVPKDGQFWYRPSGGIGYIDIVDSDGEIYALLNGEVKGVKGFDSAIFAPAATDILKEIPFVSLSFEVYETRFEFRVWEGLKLIAKHENPHEAAALAWLSIQEIQKN
jgi:hypothetical protein